MKRLTLILLSLLLLTGCQGHQGDPVENRDPDHNPRAVTTKQDQIEEGGPIDPDAVIEHDVDLTGPYGKLSLHLPVGWGFHELGTDRTEEQRGSLYAIQFYPLHSGGAIEVGYHESFGVCGTGLREETVTLAGQQANVGYYDNHPWWDFIVWHGELEGIVALQDENTAMAWTEEQQAAAMEILNSLRFDRETRTGCIGFYTPESEAEQVGVSLSMRDVSPSGATLVWRCREPERATGTLQYSCGYSLQRQEGEDWVPLPHEAEDFGFDEPAYPLSPDEENTQAVDWTWVYGELEPGTYRYCTQVMEFRDTGDYDTYELSACFLVN